MATKCKVTTLDGYYFREDVDDLVFDRHEDGRNRDPYNDADPIDLLHLVPVDLFRRGRRHPPFGCWKITIEFDPRRVPSRKQALCRSARAPSRRDDHRG